MVDHIFSPYSSSSYIFLKDIFNNFNNYTSNNDDDDILKDNDKIYYGKVIPKTYGTVKVSGNIIWKKDIKAIRNNEVDIIYKKILGYGEDNLKDDYSYYATFAVGLCEGVIDDINRLWVNSKLTDISKFKYRVYIGDNIQEIDPLIQGNEDYPVAFRGLAYVVFEDFPLGEYDDKIPKLEFEVIRNINQLYDNEPSLEDKIKGITIIPGSGEFVYDTKIQSKVEGIKLDDKLFSYGYKNDINNNTENYVADSIVSLNQLEKTLPNIEWISVVVTWFIDSLDMSNCSLYPAVEYKDNNIQTISEDWKVAHHNRENARIITYDDSGNPIYGGTISDKSLINFLLELKDRGYNIMLYPILLVDSIEKPWRGNLTINDLTSYNFFAKEADVHDFFIKSNGYNNFIKHYANLVGDIIDVFSIGSELKGITQFGSPVFPGVSELVNLAREIRGILGSEKKITYAADWSEYHSYNGFYNMDPLWSSEYIDYVGIDAYFPISDGIQPNRGFSRDELISGWDSGEYIDYYYDNNRSDKINIDNRKYSIKDINHWWDNRHSDENGDTLWRPRMKKIWFTEYGFPSVNGATNQPNVFIDPSSIESNYPYLSNFNVDFKAQRVAIDATIERWKDSDMIEHMFLWTWDARPYPYFPELLNIWNDGDNWKTGHWIQGKLSISILGAIIKDILESSLELDDLSINIRELDDIVNGFIIDKNITIRDIVYLLSNVYFFDLIEADKELRFTPKKDKRDISIINDELINHDKFKIHMDNSVILSKIPNISYFNRNHELITYSGKNKILHFPLILDNSYVEMIANKISLSYDLLKKIYTLTLPNKYLYLEVSDIISLLIDGYIYKIIIINIEYSNSLKIKCISYSDKLYNNYVPYYKIQFSNNLYNIINDNIYKTETYIFDTVILPFYNEYNNLYFSINSLDENWKGAIIYQSINNGNSYDIIGEIKNTSTVGYLLNDLKNTNDIHVINDNYYIDLILSNGDLSSTDLQGLVNYDNIALIGDEIIQFQNIKKIFDSNLNIYIYRLFNILRGRFNTDNNIVNIKKSGTRFILLNNFIKGIKMSYYDINDEKIYKVISIGQDIKNVEPIKFKYKGNSFKIPDIVQLNSKIDGDNIFINWNRRSHIPITLKDYIDIPLNKYFKCYEVIIYYDDQTNFKDFIYDEYITNYQCEIKKNIYDIKVNVKSTIL